MKEGAIFGAVAAFFVYMMLPIYGDNGIPAGILPTANVVSGAGYSNYLANLPFSMIVFFSLEILGVSLGIAAQMILRKPSNLNK